MTTEKDKAALKPCPFCKSEPELIRRVNDFTTRQTAIIKCTKPGCTCEMRVGVIRQSYQWAVDRVIEKWNTRAASAPAAGVPAGWKLVPTEPTGYMLLQGTYQFNGTPIEIGTSVMSNKIYKAMLAAAPEPEKAQGDDVMTDKELRDWIFQWSQNEGKIPLESDINDLIWTIQKYAPPAVSPADAGVESAGELAEKIYEWCACLTRDDAENQIRGLLGRISRASLSAGQGVAEWVAITKLEDMPQKQSKCYEQYDCYIFHEGRIKEACWNCEHLVWDDASGDDFFCDALEPTHYMLIPTPFYPASPATKSKPSGRE